MSDETRKEVSKLVDDLPSQEKMMSKFLHLLTDLKLVSGGLNLVVAPQICIQIENARGVDIASIVEAVIARSI